MTASTDRFVRRPTLVSGGLALLSGVVAVGLVAETVLQRQILLGAAVGVVVFALGGRLWRRGHVAVGVPLALSGCLLVAVAAGYAAVRPPQIVHRLELLPGILGLWTLAAALVPLRFRWSRLLVDVGAGMVFLPVLAGGVVRGASTAALVVAGAATILAWDAGENAVSVGGQVGAGEAATARAEVVHAGVGCGVAVVAVVAVLGVTRLGVDDLPLAALVALLVAGVALALVSHRGRGAA